jgi:hypothetical protein
MRPSIFKKRRVAILVLVIVLLGGGMGCSTTVKEKQGEPTKSEEKTVSKQQAKYYHFNDVLVPGELNYHQKKSFIYETPQFKTGTLVFSKWRLDVGSLIDFFSYQMEKDNWKLVNSFKGKENVLNFSKPDKNCTIKIYDRWDGVVEVEIRVGPLGEKKM